MIVRAHRVEAQLTRRAHVVTQLPDPGTALPEVDQR